MPKSQNKIKAFSSRFNEVLVDKGWHHLPDSELCKKFGKGNTTVWNWKNAVKMPAIETAIDIAIVLDVCVDWLLTGRGHKHPDLSDDDDDNGRVHLDISGLPHGQQVHLRALVHSIQEQGTESKKKISLK
jgi:transcriptional regulator with XRE-family HTH domain